MFTAYDIALVGIKEKRNVKNTAPYTNVYSLYLSNNSFLLDQGKSKTNALMYIMCACACHFP